MSGPENEPRGFVTIELGDGVKKLRFTMASLAELDEQLGKSSLWMITQEDQLGPRLLIKLIYAGLKGAGSTWKEADVARLMKTEHFADYLKAVRAALKASGLIQEAAPEGEDLAPLPHTEGPGSQIERPEAGIGTG